MKITELKENQVVHCKTHEEAERVLELAHEAGMKWRAGNSYIEDDNWGRYQEETCYKFTSGSFGRIPFFKSEGYEIIPSEKITDMENKTEFFEERVMEVSHDNTDWKRRVVFGKKNGKYLAWNWVETVEEAKKRTDAISWNYAREIDPFRELKEAYARGEDIQYRFKGGDWTDTPNPAWHPFHEYRIKPKSKPKLKSKYVPFTFEDAEKFMNRIVISKDKSCKAVITYADGEDVLLCSYRKSYQYLFESYTFLDGSPCGKEVKE